MTLNTPVDALARALADVLAGVQPPAPVIPTASTPEAEALEVLRRKRTLRPDEVSKLYGLEAETLKSWRAQGRGPAYTKIGNMVYYNTKDVDDYFLVNRIKTVDQP